jgi:hypothetical protein
MDNAGRLSVSRERERPPDAAPDRTEIFLRGPIVTKAASPPIWSVSSLSASADGGKPNGLIGPAQSGVVNMSAVSVGKCSAASDGLPVVVGPACLTERTPLGLEQGDGSDERHDL